MKWFLLIVAAYQAHSASVCDPQKFEGKYGVQLSGTTTISGSLKPVALIGRLVFDGHGAVSGYVSVNFTGLLLGNPVNGTYEAGTDCSLNWKLQDDSGAYQNFKGTMTSDFLRVQFHQTDDGAARDGLMVRTPKECSTAALHERYDYTISGSTTPMLPGETGHRVSSSGLLEVGAASNTMEVDSDCIVQIQLALHLTDSDIVLAKLRGVLLDDGKEILAIQTDPGATVTARFIAK